jgi:hypothetical protein
VKELFHSSRNLCSKIRRLISHHRIYAFIMLALAVMLAGFVPPASRLAWPVGGHATVRMQEMWTPPKDLGPLGDLDRLFPNDVQFNDIEGDEITLRGKGGNKVEYYSNGKGRMRSASLRVEGNTLQISGVVKKPVPVFSLIGFNLEEFVTDAATPKDPADLDRAMALVGGKPREIV